ncbi:hypothetical protein QJS10_CPA09g00137 [Acorus calamus]|uniref:Ultraviolet-B-repressible protein n=1 Tax=Acorus calamus TaxID=4465 RepID=A0AAV9E6J2_ACOCL|nr:hypothetical protein QJS10_CPA09g00137 [Acorus calamus]
MASTSAVSAAMRVTSSVGQRKPMASELFQHMKLTNQKSSSSAVHVRSGNGGAKLVVVRASMREKAVTGLTAAALTAAMVLPDIAEAAQPGVSPSLKNFLLSIVAGGVVLTVIVGAVVGVSNFDPVKRS